MAGPRRLARLHGTPNKHMPPVLQVLHLPALLSGWLSMPAEPAHKQVAVLPWPCLKAALLLHITLTESCCCQGPPAELLNTTPQAGATAATMHSNRSMRRLSAWMAHWCGAPARSLEQAAAIGCP